MASVNNVFLIAGEPYIRFVKAIPSRVAGIRLDPTFEGVRSISFVLESDPDDPDAEVLCLYSEKELTYFNQMNKTLIKLGYFKPYEEPAQPMPTETSALVSDTEVNKIAQTKSVAAMREKLEGITSHALILRIKNAAEDLGASSRIIKLINEREQEIINGG